MEFSEGPSIFKYYWKANNVTYVPLAQDFTIIQGSILLASITFRQGVNKNQKLYEEDMAVLYHLQKVN
jgi:hypothetical protein